MWYSIAQKDWVKVKDLIREHNKNSCFIQFANEKDWFSFYGDYEKMPSLQNALEYYETISDVPKAVETYQLGLQKGLLKEKTSIENYSDLRFKEKMLEDFLVENLEILEKGLKLIQRQFPTLVGPIDILAKDSRRIYVVIELKKGKPSDKTFGQLQRYRGWVKDEMAQDKEYVRGIIVGGEIDQRLKYAVKSAKAHSDKHLQLFEFKFTGSAEEIKV